MLKVQISHITICSHAITDNVMYDDGGGGEEGRGRGRGDRERQRDRETERVITLKCYFYVMT